MIRNTDTITLLTLGPQALELQDAPLVMTDSFRMLKTEGSFVLEGATLVDGDGPLDLYMVSTDLSVAEMAECIALDGPASREDRVGSERVMRPVWKLTDSPISFRPPAAGGDDQSIGSWARSMRWTFGDGGATGSFGVAAYNLGSGALSTGATLKFTALHYGVWVGA